VHRSKLAALIGAGVIALGGMAGCEVEEGTDTPRDRSPAGEAAPNAQPKPAVSGERGEALESAESYLDTGDFSRESLIGQLEYEGFSKRDATWAVDRISPDWKAEAAESAQSYLDTGSFSRASLLDQLLYEGFTQAQAEYGVSMSGL
jgi:hypothetical protein